MGQDSFVVERVMPIIVMPPPLDLAMDELDYYNSD